MKIKNYSYKTFNNNRLAIIKYLVIAIFSIIFIRIIYLNVYLNSYYKMILNTKTSSTVYGETAPRGRILDRNLKVIVDNVSVKSIYYQKVNDLKTSDEISLAYEISSYLDLDYENLSTRSSKEFYILLYPKETDDLITKEEYGKLSYRKLTDKDIYELKISRITAEDLLKLREVDKKAAFLYYLMNKGYYYKPKLIKEDISDLEYAYFSENKDSLQGFTTSLTWKRIYPYQNVLRTILGTISNHQTGVPEDNLDYYLKLGYALDDIVGLTGLEKEYDELLKGSKNKYLVEDDNSLTLIEEGKKGNDLVLSIDIDVQKDLEDLLEKEVLKTKSEPNTDLYNKSFLAIANPKTGEIYAAVGKRILNNQITDYSYGVMNYTVTPGSVVKGASITVGYKTKVIDIGSVMEDRCIKFANMPEKCSWSTLGVINDLTALKWSSNVYQYKIAMKVGGFNYSYNKKLEIDPEAFSTYRNIFYQYGLGSSTGIDFPNEEKGLKGESTAPDLLVNFAIGQYDTYTPMQILQYISTIANNGSRLKMHFLKGVVNSSSNTYTEVLKEELNKVEIENKYISRIKEGLRLVMESGTGVGFMNNVFASGKTGTSESFVDVDNDSIVDYESISNSFAGYAPSDDPIMSITAISPDVQNPSSGSFKSNVNRRIASKATDIFFNYYDLKGNLKNK